MVIPKIPLGRGRGSYLLWPVPVPMLKTAVRPNVYPLLDQVEKSDWFVFFQRALAPSETQTSSFRFWTLVALSLRTELNAILAKELHNSHVKYYSNSESILSRGLTLLLPSLSFRVIFSAILSSQFTKSYKLMALCRIKLSILVIFFCTVLSWLKMIQDIRRC